MKRPTEPNILDHVLHANYAVILMCKRKDQLGDRNYLGNFPPDVISRQISRMCS